MIKAIIENKGGGTLVTEFPCDIYNLYSELHSVGVTKRPNDVKLTDNEDEIGRASWRERVWVAGGAGGG